VDSRPDGRPFGCEPNGPCTDCSIPTLLRFLCHKNVTRIVEMCVERSACLVSLAAHRAPTSVE